MYDNVLAPHLRDGAALRRRPQPARGLQGGDRRRDQQRKHPGMSKTTVDGTALPRPNTPARRSACCPASSCRAPASRSTSASSTSRSRRPTPVAPTPATAPRWRSAPSHEVSFATYFNAFPASYWRRWSTSTSVVLRVELTGTGRVDVYRSKATGARSSWRARFASTGSEPAVLEFQVACSPSRTAAGSGSTSPPTPSDPAQRRLVRRPPAPGAATSPSGSRPSTAPATASTRCAPSPRTRWSTR